MRIGVLGMGWVGTSVAISTLHMGVATELLLNDLRAELAEGEALDLAHGASFYPAARVRAAGVDELLDTDAVVLAAGRGGKPGQSRLDLLAGNAALARDVGTRFRNYRGLFVVVTNPVDVLVRLVAESSGLPPARVLGTGTLLDTARLRQVIGREFRIESRSVHAHVVGEHGDSEVVLWSAARIGGSPIRGWKGWSADKERLLATEVRTAAGEIIRRKGATNHAIGLATAALLRWMLRDERRVVTVSRVQEGVAGLKRVALSLPTIVGRDGAVEVLEPELDGTERDALHRSAGVLEEAYARTS